MKKRFAIGILGIILLEIANVYFIMPMPGSQRMRSLALAYALYRARWYWRVAGWALVASGLSSVWRASRSTRLAAATLLLAAGSVTYLFNFVMAADHMFRQPTVVRMVGRAENTVAEDRLVVGIMLDGQARAYPLQFIGYHHQVRDTIAGQQVMVSYCTVCRTGRIFTPAVNGTPETFRLVGMDRFNAMFEDATTGSWWRQANGEAVVGPRKGTALPELPTRQVTLRQWLALYPQSLIMQGDPAFTAEYAKDYSYERGTSRSTLTGTDTASWNEKSWVVGLAVGDAAKAYDWNALRRERIVHDLVGKTPIVLVLSPDSASFFAFVRPDTGARFALVGDSLVSPSARYSLTGSGPAGTLTPLNASQEFWHSWRTFHPNTERYGIVQDPTPLTGAPR